MRSGSAVKKTRVPKGTSLSSGNFSRSNLLNQRPVVVQEPDRSPQLPLRVNTGDDFLEKHRRLWDEIAERDESFGGILRRIKVAYEELIEENFQKKGRIVTTTPAVLQKRRLEERVRLLERDSEICEQRMGLLRDQMRLVREQRACYEAQTALTENSHQ